MNPSIRNRLLFTLMPLTLAMWVLMGVVIYNATQEEVGELIDAQLVQSARALLNLLSHEYYEEEQFRGRIYDDTMDIPQQFSEHTHRFEQKLVFQMWMLDGHKLGLRSQGAPGAPMSDADAGFSDRTIDGLSWRVYVLTDTVRGIQVQVGESSERRSELSKYIAIHILIPVVVAIPLVILMIWYGVGRAMKPLRKIAGDVQNRRPDNLHPIHGAVVPLEAKPLVDALNSLFQRLQQAFETERRFTADAAHELRTPLAAIKTQAQVALRAGEDDVRRQALTHVISGVDRATHLAQQLLTLARIDPAIWVGRDQVSLRELAAEALAESTAAALARRIDLGLEAGVAGMVQGDRSMLGIMVRNLIDNALKFTPEGGKVEVTVDQSGARSLLRVEDSGPGIAPEDRNRVFERFYRQMGTQVPGSGLGLSIVKRITELHHAEIRLDASSSLGGLLVEVAFPEHNEQ